MAGYRLNLFLLALLAGTLALAWSVGRDVSQPNYESLVEGQMVRSPAYDSFAPNPNFPDGLTLRLPPSGTIARGQMPLPYQATPEDAIRAGLVLRNPFSEKDDRRQARGGVVFSNFCQVCHGPLGLGDGPVTQGGFPPPPSLLTDRALRMPEGQMFHVLTYGQGRMPAVAAQLSPDDRWCALLHVRELQRLQVPSDKQAPFTFAEVAQLFRQNCSACHGEDGRGTLMRKGLPNIPDFTDLAWQVAQTEMALVNQIDYGSLPLMPAFRYKLNRDEIVALAVYVRSFPSRQAGRPAPLTYLSPVQVYQTYCFACHDTTGRGVPFWRKLAPALPNFTSADWQASRTDKELAQSIMVGKGNFMLRMSDKLGAAKVQEMVALVREFKGGEKVIPLARPKSFGPPPPEKITTRPPDLKALPTPAEDLLPAEAVKPLPVPPDEWRDRARRGAVTFSQICYVCHGNDGRGNVQRDNFPEIPNFKDAKWQKTKKDAELLISILEGKGAHMPAHGDRITRNEAKDLVAFVRSFGPAPPLTARAPAQDTDFWRQWREMRRQYDELERQLQGLKAQPGP
jgi:mono/diheme cytochrome c family protein